MSEKCLKGAYASVYYSRESHVLGVCERGGQLNSWPPLHLRPWSCANIVPTSLIAGPAAPDNGIVQPHFSNPFGDDQLSGRFGPWCRVSKRV